MANWCNNIVEFEGSEEALKEVEQLFQSLKEKEEQTKHGQLPEFVQSDTGYLFNPNWDDAVLTFETKWLPNLEVIKKVAEHFNVSYLHSYCELGCLVYGEASYRNGMFSTFVLEPEDFDLYDMNPEDEDTWIFEGQVYESDHEILEILLERKKQNIR
jgi:hypothetical protein